MALVVKNLPANAGDERDVGLTSGREDSLRGLPPTPISKYGLENHDRGARRLQSVDRRVVYD